jgi:hypothetical protein
MLGLLQVRTTAATHALYLFDVFAVLIFAGEAKIAPAINAAVGSLVALGFGVEGIAGWRYSDLVHEGASLWARLRGAGTPAGPFLVNTRIVSFLYRKYKWI